MPISRRDVLKGSAASLISSASVAMLCRVPPARAGDGGWRLPDKNPVRMIENQWIAMKDGIQLSARIWLPDTAQPAPVVLEYIPYRKRDLYRTHDNSWGQQLAQYGIGYARVDARGSGDSQGVLVDEYLEQELLDGVELIAWLARQPWSSGSVGMRGISWGGINTLQIAALEPPELKAIMPMCCTDTRYTDDAHYIGGALGLTDLQWGVQFKAVMAMPPDPAIAGESWRHQWQQRLEAAPPILEKWLSHQRDDAFWRRGSVSTDYRRIKCPIYIVDGWVDTYVNSVTRLLAHMDEPMMRAYMPYRTASEGYPMDTPGRWVAENAWPSPHIRPRTWYLDERGLAPKAGTHSEVKYVGDQIVGLDKPEWLPFPPEGLPTEQSSDDRKSLLFDSGPLGADIEILGHPIARIRVAADQPVAKLALRLCEVTPAGESWLVTYGLLNLTHRHGNAEPVALTPDQAYDVTIELSLIAHRFKAGNRIRLAVSESLWPLVWPSPLRMPTVGTRSAKIRWPTPTP